jgi:hypothetical protein
VTVIEYVPLAVEVAVVIVMPAEPPVINDAGLKLTVTPEGTPLAVSVTCCEFPAVTVVEMVADIEPPAWIEPEVGLTERERSSVAVVFAERHALTGCSSHPLYKCQASDVCPLSQ